jgi:AcrR family transcriptional regulator
MFSRPNQTSFLPESDRLRLYDTCIEATLERGFGLDVGEIALLAAVDEREAEASYPTLDDLLDEVADNLERDFRGVTLDAYENGPGPWRERVRRAAYAAAEWLRDHSREVRWAVAALKSHPPAARRLRTRTLKPFVDIIDDGRRELRDPTEVSPAVAEGLVGLLLDAVVREVSVTGGTERITELVPGLMYVVLSPYVGHEQAAEELSRSLLS